ncbi:MAG: hypothetical protein ACOYJ2_06515 [Rickettsiales bacterium]
MTICSAAIIQNVTTGQTSVLHLAPQSIGDDLLQHIADINAMAGTKKVAIFTGSRSLGKDSIMPDKEGAFQADMLRNLLTGDVEFLGATHVDAPAFSVGFFPRTNVVAVYGYGKDQAQGTVDLHGMFGIKNIEQFRGGQNLDDVAR